MSKDKIGRKGFREKRELYHLNTDTIGAWHDCAGIENRKLIKKWAKTKLQVKDVARELKDRKAEIADELQEQKSKGVKITDKFLTALIDGDERIQDIRQRRDELEVLEAELYQVMLLYRDMWSASPIIRQEATLLMKYEMNE